MLSSPRIRRTCPSILPYLIASFFSVLPIFLAADSAWAAVPVITAPATASGTEGSAIAPITATAADADPTDLLTITRTGEPASLTYTASSGVSPRTARLSGTLAPGDAANSPYYIVWTVTDGTGGSASTTTVLTVNAPNRQPVANPGGPYAPVCPGVEVCFDGARSTDPDLQQTLTYSWSFGDGAADAPGQRVCHSFQSCGSYNVCLTVTDNGNPALSNTACTTQQISPPQLSVSRKSSGVINLKNAKATDQETITATLASSCISPDDISWKMKYLGSEVVPDSHSSSGTSTTLIFNDTILSSLLSSLSAGKSNPTVTIEGVAAGSQCTVSSSLSLSIQK